MAEQLLSCEHPTSRNPSSKKQGNKPARTAGKRPVRQLRYLRLTIFDSLWRLCVSFFLSVARRRLQQFAASFRQPPHAGDWLLLPAVIMCAWTSPTSETRFEVARDRFDTGGVAFGASLIHIFWISSRFSCSCCPRRASIKLIVVSAMLCALCAPKHSHRCEPAYVRERHI